MMTRRSWLTMAGSGSLSPFLDRLLHIVATDTTMPLSSTLAYGAHAAQSATLYVPKRRGRSITCLLHGGFWRTPHGPDQLSRLSDSLCRMGYSVLNIGYRRTGEGGGWPESVCDVVDAVTHALRLMPDVNAVTLVGHSAGGHLAFMAAHRMRSQQLSVHVEVIGLAPILRLASAHRDRLGAGAVAAFMKGEIDRVPEADPFSLVPLRVPQRIVHALDDEVVPVAMSREYADAAASVGDEVELVEISGVGHMGVVADGGRAFDALKGLLARAAEPPI